ncbi:hypothetical protein V8V91_08415 [Algoriphagus halophilus]|uniref:hypothetical protein n=1 Tax=Algoriphagus halophilus TaxID=226505 RepID=UPI00358DFBA3
MEAIDKNYRWFEILFQDSTHELINGEHSINFLHLVNSMESYELQSIYLNVKLIRQELLVAATKEEFEEMKELHAFWENMEAPLLRLLKN